MAVESFRHHTDTIIVGRDAEIVTMRPPDLIKVAMLFLVYTFEGLKATFRHAVQGLNEEERSLRLLNMWMRRRE